VSILWSAEEVLEQLIKDRISAEESAEEIDQLRQVLVDHRLADRV
jgi:hypothetical protein